ncbi:hypothetical protein BDK92_2618 [Micromonospora pisi]|uniref:DUF932 domain-containing protein n=2 Tax=Micromonospora pisi TaxID=589240 RepID=A0A495JHD8_9ACTN|nr:hypothetical protein BDK92_2618 [Micromonospora pisi]
MSPMITVPANRNVELDQLRRMLADQSTRVVDVKAGAGRMRAVGGNLVLDGTEPQLGPDGVTMTAGTYTPNDVANTGLADKLGIPVAYLRRLAAEHPDLWDDNVNGWLERDHRTFLVRCLRGNTGGGVARAVLSDRYARIDNLDVLFAALDGIRQAGVHVRFAGCDLTDRRMYLRVYSPQVQVAAPRLLSRYRSPFDGRAGADLPIVSAGFLIRNSETGCGAFSISPWVRFEVCRNGMTLRRDALRRAHIGSRMTADDGVVAASEATTRKTLELITSRTTDAVTAFLDADYIAQALRELEAAAGTPITDPNTTLKVVGQQLRYTEEQQQAILAHFIAGADLSAGGVMHAVTSVAQTLTDADAAHELESTAIQALHLAAA